MTQLDLENFNQSKICYMIWFCYVLKSWTSPILLEFFTFFRICHWVRCCSICSEFCKHSNDSRLIRTIDDFWYGIVRWCQSNEISSCWSLKLHFFQFSLVKWIWNSAYAFGHMLYVHFHLYCYILCVKIRYLNFIIRKSEKTRWNSQLIGWACFALSDM